MDQDKKQEATGAELQIERLMRLKIEKDKKDKMRVDNAGSGEPAIASAKRDEMLKPAAEEGRAAKKAPNSIKVEKRLYEKLHKLVNALNVSGGGKITKAKFVNIILKEFLALDIDYSAVKNREEIKKIFGRIKTGN